MTWQEIFLMTFLQTRFHYFNAPEFSSSHSTFLGFFLFFPFKGKDPFFLLFCFLQTEQNMRQ